MSLIIGTFNKSFALNNRFRPGVVEAPSSKRPRNESHPRTALSPSVSFLRGGKTRGRDVVE